MSYAEKHRFGHGVVVFKVCYGILECVFFSHLPCRLSKCVGIDSNSGLEVGLPASQLRMFAKCYAPKGVFFDMFV